ncbi:MAG: 16S rRNA (guanine(966)-N(2))-methyltransferase RsmD [Cognaticolwellia aestuarii]
MNKRRANSRQANKSSGSIRIIAGRHRGRKLTVISADGLRPTTDRVKETVFNWLMPYIQDSRCLDCFSGAGSLGFEAISRGAEQVTMLELNNQACQQLKANQQLLNESAITVINTNTTEYLNQKATPFDIVFVDPPFRQQLTEQVTQLLANGWLAENGLVYLEMEQEHGAINLPSNWRLLKEKVAGQVRYCLFQAG